MTMQRLSERTCRRIERHTGLSIEVGWVQGWRHGDYTHQIQDNDGIVWMVNPHTWEKMTYEAAAAEAAGMTQEERREHILRMGRLHEMLANPKPPEPPPTPPRRPLREQIQKILSDWRYAKATKRWKAIEESAITKARIERAVTRQTG